LVKSGSDIIVKMPIYEFDLNDYSLIHRIWVRKLMKIRNISYQTLFKPA